MSVCLCRLSDHLPPVLCDERYQLLCSDISSPTADKVSCSALYSHDVDKYSLPTPTAVAPMGYSEAFMCSSDFPHDM